jgi:hypothetical protein
MTTFKLAIHSITNQPMVEVYDKNGNHIAGIYASEGDINSVHIVSKYFDGEPKSTGFSLVPGYVIEFVDRPPD